MSQVVICPTITAFNPHQYRTQIEQVEPFAQRVHVDLMDGNFAPTESPPLDQIWLSEKLVSDVHLMYQRPMDQIERLIELRPNLVVIHFEADVDHLEFAKRLHDQGIKVGLALLQKTSVEEASEILRNYDHALVFSGDLGRHGGQADLRLLDKVAQIRERFPGIEISWDGGINDRNAHELVEVGVTVLNVGGFIQNAADPQAAYNRIGHLFNGAV